MAITVAPEAQMDSEASTQDEETGSGTGTPVGAGRVSADLCYAKDEKGMLSYSLLEVLEKDQCPDYAAFKLTHGSHLLPIMLCMAQASVYFIRIYKSSFVGVPMIIRAMDWARLVVLIMGVLYVYLLRSVPCSKYLTPQGKRVFYVGNSVLILQSLATGLVIVFWAMSRDHCHSDHCLQDFPLQAMPLNQIFHQVIGSVGVQVCVRCHDAAACFLSIVIAYSLMFVAGCILHLSIADLGYIAAMGVGILIVFVSYEGHEVVMFKSYYFFERTLRQKVESENKEYLMKIQTEQMRCMIGNVAHDLRTPLQAFASELEVLRHNLSGQQLQLQPESQSASQISSIKQLDRLCHFMNMTINRSIDFTKVSTGLKLNPSIESVSLRDTIGWAVECMVNTHGNVPIVFPDVPSDIHNQIFTDKQWLTENLLCLMSNAQKFTTEGDITIRCTLISPAVDKLLGRSIQVLRFEVEDTGIGITKEKREKLFKPFQQAQRRTGGTGLGLYSLSKRIESLGGECGLMNRKDGLCGCCFWFTIPYKPDHTTFSEPQLSFCGNTECSFNIMNTGGTLAITPGSLDHSRNYNFQSSSSIQTKIPKLRILLVDDAPMLRKATSRALMKEGHDVEVAHHGAECLKVLESKDFAFDLILMDLQMPVMDGLEASQRIRVLESNRVSMLPPSDADISLLSNRKIMIIGLSANSESEAREDCMQSGMDGFIEKPLTMKFFQDYFLSLLNESSGPKQICDF